MDHRGVPYTIRTGIEHNRWTMVVHLPQGRTVEKAVNGARQMAETAACSVIDKWLEKNLPPVR